MFNLTSIRVNWTGTAEIPIHVLELNSYGEQNTFTRNFKIGGSHSISIPSNTLDAYNAVEGWSIFSLLAR